MPKRKDIKKILIIGAGPIVIGQACEFDYSGAQACKALKEENFKVVLVNSNPATIMTDPNLADRTYIEPLDVETISKIIEREKPDALLSTMGGQTALNLSIELERRKILKKFNVKLIGASQKVINKAELILTTEGALVGAPVFLKLVGSGVGIRVACSTFTLASTYSNRIS